MQRRWFELKWVKIEWICYWVIWPSRHCDVDVVVVVVDDDDDVVVDDDVVDDDDDDGILYLWLVWIWQQKAKIMTMHSLTNLLLLHHHLLALWRIRRENVMRFVRPFTPYWLPLRNICCLQLLVCVLLALHVWVINMMAENDRNEWTARLKRLLLLSFIFGDNE